MALVLSQSSAVAGGLVLLCGVCVLVKDETTGLYRLGMGWDTNNHRGMSIQCDPEVFWWNSSQFLGSIPGVLETEARPGPEIVVPLVANDGISDEVQVLDSDRMIFPSRNMIFKSFSFFFYWWFGTFFIFP